MKTTIVFVTAAFTLFSSHVQYEATTTSVAITHASIVDVSTGALLPDQTILISNGRIQQIDADTRISVPPSARVISARGKYVIPGLWDMHVHTVSHEVDFPLELANGITGIRDMGGSTAYPPAGNWGVTFDSLRAWRAKIQAGTLAGPRIVAAGIALDGPEAFWPQTLSLKTPAHARSVIDSLRREGIDFVKVYMLIPPDILLAIATETKKQGLMFAGHPSQFTPVVDAAAAGQRSFEHADAFESTYYDPTKLRDFMLRARHAPFPQDERAMLMRQVLATYDARSLDSIAGVIKKYGAWFDPTLVTMRSLACVPEAQAPQASRASYIPKQVRATWEARIQSRCSPVTNSLHAERWEYQRKAVHRLIQQGVEILVGSDAWNPYVVPGFSLHDEMELLVGEGMTPLEALRAATLGAARFLKLNDSLGSVTPGKLADLVLLDADPLSDIRNTKRIHAVILNGKVFDRQNLDQLLASAKASVRQ